MIVKISIKDQILLIMKQSDKPLAVHEISTTGSANNNATRLNELEREGYLTSRFRNGKKYKEWSYANPNEQD